MGEQQAQSTSRDLPAALHRWLGPLGPDRPPVYLVGGAVRDRLLGRPVKDIDLMCAVPEALARALATHHDAALVPFLKKIDAPCHRVVDRRDPNDFLDLTPISGGSVGTDLARRDFTINAMAMAVGPAGRLEDLVDPLGGQRDIADRRIRAASPQALAADPLRILRAVRFAAQLGYSIAPDTVGLMAKSAPALAAVAAERIAAELLLILETPTAAEHIRQLDAVGALAVILPEIGPMKGCTQNDYHHLDVWGHSLAALEAAEGILADLDTHFGPAAPLVETYLQAERRIALLKLALILHDAGKPPQRAVDPETGRITFLSHDAQSGRIAEAAGRRLRLSARAAVFLSALAAHHMHVLALSDPRVRPATVLRWCRRLGDASAAAILLSMADVSAIRGPAADPAWRQRHLQWAGRTVRDYFLDLKPRIEAKPLINGRDLIGRGASPGPALGRILAAVRDAQLAGTVQTRAAALAMAQSALMSLPEDEAKA